MCFHTLLAKYAINFGFKYVIDGKVAFPVCGSHCVGHIVWVILCGSHCVGHIVWVTLCGSHCVGHIVYVTLCMSCVSFVTIVSFMTFFVNFDIYVKVPKVQLVKVVNWFKYCNAHGCATRKNWHVT